MESLIITLILKVCTGDVGLYKVQDYPQDCNHYMINCVVTKGGDVEQAVDECKDGKQKDKVTNK